jgi:GDP-L-fucose synthase
MELVGVIKSIFSYRGQIIWDESKPDGAPRKVMDDRKFKKVFPDFEFTSIFEGIKTTVKYYELIYPY